jgi:hypothetical protein
MEKQFEELMSWPAFALFARNSELRFLALALFKTAWNGGVDHAEAEISSAVDELQQVARAVATLEA